MAAALFVLGFAIPAVALTIGRPQGAAWIGKPLNLSIPLTLDAQEAGGSVCPQVEVVQGDATASDNRVIVSLESGPSADTPRLHVRTSRAIEEPIVTLIVRAGCNASSSRQYVLLADPPPVDAALATVNDSAPPLRNSDGRAFASDSVAAPRTGNVARGALQSGESPRQRRAPARRATANAPAAMAARRPVARAAAPRRQAAQARNAAPDAAAHSTGRLQIDALAPVAPGESKPASPAPSDAPPQNVAVAAAQTRMPAVGQAKPEASPPGSTLATPAASAAAAAAAPTTDAPTPDPQLVQAAERSAVLEKEVATLREQAARNEQALLELRRELILARESRERGAPLTYVLGFLLLLAVCGLLWMWNASRRGTRSERWLDEGLKERQQGHASAAAAHDAVDTLPGDDGTFAAPADHTALARVAAEAAQLASAAGAVEVQAPGARDFSGSGLRDADFEAAPLPGQLHPYTRSINTEELFDVQQQAEFFLSLGQHEQAIAVLSEYVADHPGTSALAYLELLRIFHGLGRTLDYERVRRQCQQALTVRVPAFDDFQEEGRSLEHYSDALVRVEADWPGPASLPVIEELLFRGEGPGSTTFDLAAYRELLTLYAVAKEHPVGSGTPGMSVRAILAHHRPQDTLPMALPQVASVADHVSDTYRSPLDTAPMALDVPDFPPALLPEGPAHPSSGAVDVDLRDFDMAALDTLPAALRAEAAQDTLAHGGRAADAGPEHAPEAHLPDLELFDPEFEDTISPGKSRR